MYVAESAGAHGGPLRQDPPPGLAAADRPALVVDLVRLVRPLHSAKALLLMPVALIGASPWTLAAVGGVAWAALAFILASAAVYVGNDIADRHRDRRHPVKCHRPIAAGRVPVWGGYVYCAALLGLLAAVVGTGQGTYWPVPVYLALNVAYSRVLKHIPLVDVVTVALGFVLRVVQGYIATGERVAGWLLVTVFSVSLLLLIGKRRQELLEVGAAHRPALAGYSVELANALLQITAVLALVAGLIYLNTEAPFGPDHGGTAMVLSTPFALFALFRYLQIQLAGQGGTDPVRVLLHDRVMVGVCALWMAVLAATLVLTHYPVLAHAILP
ncbi:UbiA prenyltransferase family protein [Sphaerisporangium corydalis]|uniref:UbiA prenyltransferase family protein n=1 Tax=Sphaerisporangium corydalis TaxID=1441875 RepID=A0ABV9EAT8_9ACTN|nr:UbiA prenyltransferase family protein [Sphaerisporangium corydalis]